ncbi:MAG: ABC transporter permease [Bacteroidota bacterium]
MLKHHLRIAWRSMLRSTSSSFINLLSLSIGLTATLLICLWIYDEYKVDRFHEKGEALVQMLQNTATPNGLETESSLPGPLAVALAKELPEVAEAVAVLPYEWFEGEQFLLSDGQGRTFSSRNQFASRNFFSVFSYPLLYGLPDEVLADRRSVVISEELAEKLFQGPDAVGRTLEWQHDEFGGTYLVTGVFAALPQYSSAQFDAVFSYDLFVDKNQKMAGWTDSDPDTYVVLAPGVALAAFNQKVASFLQTKAKLSDELWGQPYADRYLHGTYENGKVAGGRITYLYLFAIIALMTLLIACVNFVNLTTAKASARMKEVGVKKAIGADRKSLAIQYMVEAALLATMSLVIAIGLTFLFLPTFNTIAAKAMQLSFEWSFLLPIVLILASTILLAGSYPAFYLSGIEPISALKGDRQSKGTVSSLVRKGLIVFQFSITALLMVLALVVYHQVELIQSKQLGYEKENIVWFNTGLLESGGGTEGLSEESIERFLQLLNGLPGVVNTANFAHHVVNNFGTTTGLTWPGKATDQRAQFAQISGGYDLIPTLKMQMAAGRSFSRDHKLDHDKIIFNEAAIKVMGLEDPLGKQIRLWGEEREIIGVVKDFHFESLYKNIEPLFLKLDTDDFASDVMVQLAPGNQLETLGRIEKVYQSFFLGGMPFEPHYLDDNYQALYASEIRVSALSKYFTGIAILISCLGLFGFATFTVQRRSKEMAIRKVLGSSALQIIGLLLRSFLSLVVLALVISLPIAHLIARNWLDTFAFRIDLGPTYFVIAAFAIVLLCLLTVGGQLLRAKGVDMVKYIQQSD